MHALYANRPSFNEPHATDPHATDPYATDPYGTDPSANSYCGSENGSRRIL